MIWLTWRQFRTQAWVVLAALAALTLYLVILGLSIRHSYNTGVVGCQATDSCSNATYQFTRHYNTQVSLVGLLLILTPALIGAFWGAPLITRELETGTYRLVWNQSMTRTRWLSVKLAVTVLATLAVTGVLSLLLTWAASPYDRLRGQRFATADFDSRNLVPLGYAVFAFLLGTAIGLLIRRTLPAMALTLAVFALAQIVIPATIRPHLMAPVEQTVSFTAETMSQSSHFGISAGGHDNHPPAASSPLSLGGYTIPGAWMLTSESPLLKADGQPATVGLTENCRNGSPAQTAACLATQKLRFTVSYQPSSRYWPFQWIETSAYLVLAALLAGFCFWRLPRIG